jgi:hypothetical protein
MPAHNKDNKINRFVKAFLREYIVLNYVSTAILSPSDKISKGF